MRNLRRVFTIAVATSIMVAAFAVPAMAGPEGTLLSRINNSRAAAGLAPVEGYWDLTDDARAHSGRMMDTGSIYHNPALSGVTGVWQKLGENVGVGADANSLHDAFMASASHRSNILGDFNYVGVGTKTDDAGILWVTVIFMKAAPGLNGGGETTTTSQPPPTTTTTAAPAPAPQDPTPQLGVQSGTAAAEAFFSSTVAVFVEGDPMFGGRPMVVD
ncbi:MAG: CAP domain-containing protein [Acidimicrobiia bacterium]